MSDWQGWVAAGVACLAYGSYGVPVKATLDMEVNPLILQSYKTVVLFAMSWFVLVLGEEFKMTPLGLLSGLLWVSGGAFGIFGIRNAGMAIAVGTWASVMVLVNFVWGILIFHEPVHSILGATCAFALLMLGLVGMSKYSAVTDANDYSQVDVEDDLGEGVELIQQVAPSDDNNFGLTSRKRDDSMVSKLSFSSTDSAELQDSNDPNELKPSVPWAYPMTQREYGILCALMNGVLAGSSLLPLHYAKAQGFGGMSYILSFGTGAFVANIFLWIVYFGYQHLIRSRDFSLESLQTTLDSMPPLHLKELWKRGLAAGVLLAIGMFGSILATSNLGQGVGNSLVQTKILVSGLWGIFWFKEITGTVTVAKWFLSAATSVLAIIWLSFERFLAKDQEEKT